MQGSSSVRATRLVTSRDARASINRESPILLRVRDERVRLTIIQFCKRLKDRLRSAFYENKRSAKSRTGPKPPKWLPYCLSKNGVVLMKASVKWIDGVQFLIESGSGHAVLIEGPESEGGRGIGIRPMELMLMGLGGCASFDVL